MICVTSVWASASVVRVLEVATSSGLSVVGTGSAKSEPLARGRSSQLGLDHCCRASLQPSQTLDAGPSNLASAVRLTLVIWLSISVSNMASHQSARVARTLERRRMDPSRLLRRG